MCSLRNQNQDGSLVIDLAMFSAFFERKNGDFGRKE